LWVWAVGSPFMALLLAALAHGSAIWITHDPQRPKRSVRICLSLAATSGAMTLAALGVILFARFADVTMADTLTLLVGPSTYVVAEGAGITSGFLTAAYHILN